MNWKTILIILLIVQTGLIAFFYRPGQEHKTPDRVLFDNLDVEKLTAITIIDDQDKKIILSKDDQKWQIGQGKFPGDEEDIDNILQKIAGLKSSRLVTRTKASHSRLKVSASNFNKKVELKGAGSNTLFYLGTAPNSKSVHLRIDGENQVYQVKGLSSWELATDQDSWWQSIYVKQDVAKLAGLELKTPSGHVTLQRSADDTWQLDGSESLSLDHSKVDKLVQSVCRLSIDEYLDSGYTAVGAPVATLDYRTKDDSSFTLEIWDKDGENGEHVVKRSNAKYFAKIKAYILKDILAQQPENLRATADTPKPAE